MKQKILTFGIIGLLISCGDNKPKEADKVAESAPIVEAKTGESLILGSDCLSCHKIDEKLVGPSYTEIATKYTGQSGINETLAKSIIEGSTGKWGEVPMTPHPAITVEDAKLMVDYILTLKK